MTQIRTVKDIIGLWASRRELAADIDAKTDAVHKWASNNRIPSEWQSAVLAAARIRGYDQVTAELIVQSHARHGERKVQRA